MDIDVIIAGASFTGIWAGVLLAEAGLQVTILDQSPREHLGQSWPSIMIDVDTFSKTGIPRSTGDELLYLLDVFYAYSPSLRIKKHVENSALMIDGFLLIQRLLTQGEAAGLKYIQDPAQEIMLGPNGIKGVITRSGQPLLAPLTVDASGTAQTLVKQVYAQRPEAQNWVANLNSDYGIAYRKLCQTGCAPNELHIHFCVRGGYVWRSPNDIGIGMMSRMETEQVKGLLGRFQEEFDWQIDALSHEAVGQIPVRYPLTNLVAPGFMVVGDAALMVNSVRGGGVSPGLKGATLLAETAKRAFADQDFSMDALWDYNHRFHSTVGAQLAYQDVMRTTIMDESTDNMEFLLEKDIVTADDIKNALSGYPLDFSPMQKLQKGLRGASHPTLLLHFNHKLHWGKIVWEHFKAYPQRPDGYSHWESKLHEIQEKTHG